MKKVFLYLYPIEEFSKPFLFDNAYYEKRNIKKPFLVLNEVIQRRYRNNDYHVVFALYPDKEIFGINQSDSDKIIFADITFNETNGYDENGIKKPITDIKYPDGLLLIKQLGEVDELVIGGYHAHDCVKKVGEIAILNGINTIVDLEMTDLFFGLYYQTNYFNIDSYNPENFKNYMIEKNSEYGREFAEGLFHSIYQSSVYGFDSLNNHRKL